jgi:hypothetical protein
LTKKFEEKAAQKFLSAPVKLLGVSAKKLFPPNGLRHTKVFNLPFLENSVLTIYCCARQKIFVVSHLFIG